VIILTSNIGSAAILDAMESGVSPMELKERVTSQVRTHFRPEFINRIDESIVFQGLQKNQIQAIVCLQADKVKQRLAEKKIKMELHESAVVYLANRGYEPAFGARPVKRVVQQELETALAKGILRGDFGEEDVVVIEAVEGRLVVKKGGEQSGNGAVAIRENPAELIV
jgi:ATP-dependent Clp protease ATP-binding subunit ClpB